MQKKLTNITADIKFIRACQTVYLVSTFANVKLVIRHENKKLKTKISRLIMKIELQNKYQQKNKIR